MQVMKRIFVLSDDNRRIHYLGCNRGNVSMEHLIRSAALRGGILKREQGR